MKSSRFGYKVLKSEPLDQLCPKCGKANLELNVIGRYISFLYIPMSGTRKKASVFCGSCEEIFTGSKIPHQVKDISEAAVKKTKSPIWFYTGMILLIIGIIIKLVLRFYRV